jgi:Ca2+-binding RTX toxin-like protein
MNGGTGDDQYFVADAGDIIHEAAGEGTNDRVYAHVTYKLAPGAEIEVMSTDDHAGTNAIDLTGNELANLITGNDGDNHLSGAAGPDRLYGLDGNDVFDGGPGDDVMSGGLGDDTYYVDSAQDSVWDEPFMFGTEGGTDRIIASVSFSIPRNQGHIEFLNAADPNATSPISLSGDSFDQTITGNAGDNIIAGGVGAPVTDTLIGLSGDDTYVDFSSDSIIVEAIGGGFDRAFPALGSYTMPSGSEIEVVEGDWRNNTIIGNEFDNQLIGNDGDDDLHGGDGADSLYGGRGHNLLYGDNGDDRLFAGAGNVDVLVGGAGADKFILDTVSSGGDILDFTPGLDRLQFNALAFGFTPGEQLVAGGNFVTADNTNSMPSAVEADPTFLLWTQTDGWGYLAWDQDGTGDLAPGVLYRFPVAPYPSAAGSPPTISDFDLI